MGASVYARKVDASFSRDRKQEIGFYVNSIQTEQTASGKAAINWRWDKSHKRPHGHSLRRRCGQLGLCGILRPNPGLVGWDWIPLTSRQIPGVTLSVARGA